jgi:hypothetical protein
MEIRCCHAAVGAQSSDIFIPAISLRLQLRKKQHLSFIFQRNFLFNFLSPRLFYFSALTSFAVHSFLLSIFAFLCLSSLIFLPLFIILFHYP